MRSKALRVVFVATQVCYLLFHDPYHFSTPRNRLLESSPYPGRGSQGSQGGCRDVRYSALSPRSLAHENPPLPFPDCVPASTSATPSHIASIYSSQIHFLTLFSSFVGDDDEGAGEFFVQCETCNVWQHGQCMGIGNEDAVKADHYYCEQCRPDLHVELLKYAAALPAVVVVTDRSPRLSRKIAKRPRDRHSSTTSHSNAVSANRKSRSHSPTHQKPQKRRNTMNSRDAAYDELMVLLVEHSAAEAAAAVVTQSSPSPINGSVNRLADTDEQVPSPATSKKKRKRGSEDAFVSLTIALFTSLSQLLSLEPQLSAPDPRRRLRIDLLYPSLHLRTHQCRRPSLSQCLRPRYRLRRAARRAIDAEVVIVADPPPRRTTLRLWMARRVVRTLSDSSEIIPTHFRNRQQRGSRAEQPSL